MSELERYLRSATRGLWGRRRTSVRTELESHVRHRALRHELEGASEAEAISRALSELGRPETISAGMAGVYTMPNVIRSSLLVAALSAAVVLSLPSSTAQVAATDRFPTPACLAAQPVATSTGFDPCRSFEPWLNVSSLRTTLAPLGVKVVSLAYPLTTTYNRNPDPGTFLELTFPGGKPARVRLQLDFGYEFGNTGPSENTTSPNYVNGSTLVDELGWRSGLPVTLSGWDNPRLTVGATSFTLGSSSAPVPGVGLYPRLLELNLGLPFFQNAGQNADDILGFSGFDSRRPDALRGLGPHHVLKVPGAPGTVYVVCTRMGPTHITGRTPAESRTVSSSRQLYIVPVSAAGTIEFYLEAQRLEFVRDFDALKPARDGEPTKALLVRLTGRFDPGARKYEIVVPNSPASDGVR